MQMVLRLPGRVSDALLPYAAYGALPVPEEFPDRRRGAGLLSGCNCMVIMGNGIAVGLDRGTRSR